MAITHTDTNIENLKINKFNSLADFQNAVNQSLIDPDEISFVTEIVQADWNETNQNSESYIKHKPVQFVSLAYADLVQKINNSKLVAGTWYRIKDYTATTSKNDTRSAGNVFDVCVLAMNKNTLCHEALAMRNENMNNNYFNNSNLEAWRLWYDVNNDTEKYDWADTSNGKGVIYRMIDEWGNDLPYDFKNIQFLVGANTTAGTAAGVYYYTFSDVDILDEQSPKDKSLGKHCFDNVFQYSRINDSKMILSSAVFRNTSSSYLCSCNKIYGKYDSIVCGGNCVGNLMNYNCSNIYLGYNCKFNTFGASCSGMTLESNCSNNVFGNSCYVCSLDQWCSLCLIGDSCTYLFFTQYCININIKNGCSSIILCDTNYQNGNYYKEITVESNNRYISISYSITSPSAQNYLQNIHIESGTNTGNQFYAVNYINRNRSYKTKVGKNSAGNIAVYCEEDVPEVSSDFFFTRESTNETFYSFSEENKRSYIVVEINTDIVIDIDSKNNAENYIRFKNTGANDALVKINSITDSISGETASSGWAGITSVLVNSGKYVEVSFVVHIPTANDVDMSTVMCSNNF